MRAQDIRRTFVEFFRARDHRVWPSSSLIPNDPTLLLTVAGMVQFKPYFLGEAVPDHPRAVSVQKVARTNDIENVGRTTRHLTFFEMLGNFSFGDYFKREAIRWAWELATSPVGEGGFGFPPERIWATIYLDDDEAERLWLAETDVPASRLVRRGAADNYWSTGGPGPCGPCSELYLDRGPEHGAEGGPDVDESRYLEFWNLVFMQFETAGGSPGLHGSDALVGPLPQPSVDTGMGFERMAMLLQGVPNLFETDVMRPMLDRAVELTGVRYGADATSDIWLRVIAEHARSSSILIADGVLPSNEARGYVLRRLLRRAVRAARVLGSDQPLMKAMTDEVIATLGDAWPELRQQAELIMRIATHEEAAFDRTLRTGMVLLEGAMGRARDAGARQLDAKDAFTLHDTYGFPVDLTVEIAQEQGLDLDRDAFAVHMEQQRARARANTKAARSAAATDAYKALGVGRTQFTGYDRTDDAAPVLAILRDGVPIEVAEEGEEVEVVLGRTPFYAEGGGQLGDHGTIATDGGRVAVADTLSPLEGLIVHRGVVDAGELRVGEDAAAQVDLGRRRSITRGHTATHILHATLKDLLGDHAAQAGSAIDQGRFRFDFPHFEAVSPDQLAELEAKVNARIAEDAGVDVLVTSQEEARNLGATALFGEKYGDTVRVVRIGDWSQELCGGTHVGHTGEVGLFTVLSEGSIAANLRRIEAITGPEAFTHLSKERLVADAVARLLKVPTDEAPQRVAELLDKLRQAEKALERARTDAVLARARELVDSAERLAGGAVAAGVIDGADTEGLRTLALDVRNRLGTGVAVVGSRTPDGKALLVAAVTPDLVERVPARDVLQPGARLVGGGGGGKGDVAQAGGRDGSSHPRSG